MSLTDWSIRSGHLIADALAVLVGIPPQPNAWLAFARQAQREDAGGTSIGGQNNNPLNLTTANGAIVWPGQTGTYGGGDATEWHGDFAAFGSLEAGAWACADNYHNGASYAEVIAAFRAGDPVTIATAIQNSPWDSGHYGGTLADEVRSELGGSDMTDDELRAALKRVYAGPDSLEEWVKADVRVMIEQDPATRDAIKAISPTQDVDPVVNVDALVRAVGQKLVA